MRSNASEAALPAARADMSAVPPGGRCAACACSVKQWRGAHRATALPARGAPGPAVGKTCARQTGAGAAPHQI